MKRVVLFGYYGFGNAGDELILQSVLARLRGPDFSPLVFSNDPERTAADHGVPACSRWSVPGMARELRRADIFIFGGGGLIQDSTGTLGLLYYFFVLALALALAKEVRLFAVGIGPLAWPWNRTLAGRLLRRVHRISVRDPESQALLERLGVSRPVRIDADPVFALPVSFPARSAKASARPLLAVVPRPWPQDRARTDLTRSLGEGLQHFARATRCDIVLVPFQPADDAETVDELRSHLPGAGTADWKGAQDLIASLAKADFVFTLRYHGAVLAAMLGIPFAALPVDPKIRYLLRALFGEGGMRNLLADPRRLAEDLLPAWLGRERISAQMGARISGLRRRAEAGLDDLSV